MITTKSGIHVVAYVQSANGPVDVDTLSPEKKREVATALKIRYFNALYAGQAHFWEAGKEDDREQA